MLQTNEYGRDNQDKIQLLSGYRRIKAYIKEKQQWIEFHFNDRQAKVVEELHKAADYQLHTKFVEKEVLKKVVERFKFSMLFRNHKNWRLLIKSVGKGYWQLKI